MLIRKSERGSTRTDGMIGNQGVKGKAGTLWESGFREKSYNQEEKEIDRNEFSSPRLFYFKGYEVIRGTLILTVAYFFDAVKWGEVCAHIAW